MNMGGGENPPSQSHPCNDMGEAPSQSQGSGACLILLKLLFIALLTSITAIEILIVLLVVAVVMARRDRVARPGLGLLLLLPMAEYALVTVLSAATAPRPALA